MSQLVVSVESSSVLIVGFICDLFITRNDSWMS